MSQNRGLSALRLILVLIANIFIYPLYEHVFLRLLHLVARHPVGLEHPPLAIVGGVLMIIVATVCWRSSIKVGALVQGLILIVCLASMLFFEPQDYRFAGITWKELAEISRTFPIFLAIIVLISAAAITIVRLVKRKSS